MPVYTLADLPNSWFCFSIQEAEDLVDEKEVEKQIEEETRRSSRRIEGAEPRARRCGTCGNTGHNARIC